MSVALDITLCALVLGVGWATVAGHGVFRAVIFFITYGLLLAIVWARLGAYDVALAEAAISAGLTGVLLLAAHGRLRRLNASQEVPLHLNLPAAVVAVGIAAGLGWAWFALPAPTAPDLSQALPQSGVGNPVTAVLLNFRAWDTLLESVILLAALLGLWMLARDHAWDKPLGLPYHARPGGVLASFGRVLPPIGLIFGVYLVWAGADTTGGAFQGGTVLAAVCLVTIMAGVLHAPRVEQAAWRAALVLGPGVFVLSGIAGAVFAQGFLALPPALAKPAIVTIEAALTVSIAVTLVLLVIGPPDEGEQDA
ncbi:multisubunit Na+/H+ antiporter MnhB subunit [Roseinatronobacter thiooxidans]|uniref:Multisubunit Na+/H+ antiporter MnhB subunit n=1 Tax=Roseinatronobacter thiooxidans TaxID=121821 RepID=A0A2W7QCR4_9RHOB|nr:hydrogenase subunit MbhD domain-containing protein [Roseinatronobacter thiooxidans]PZX45953.1 multisubunit Na+/H+ antiporter MnhB subunit [Roseinatronobacter thiooxidans]